jgi:hypothetical protein
MENLVRSMVENFWKMIEHITSTARDFTCRRHITPDPPPPLRAAGPGWENGSRSGLQACASRSRCPATDACALRWLGLTAHVPLQQKQPSLIDIPGSTGTRTSSRNDHARARSLVAGFHNVTSRSLSVPGRSANSTSLDSHEQPASTSRRRVQRLIDRLEVLEPLCHWI